VALQCAVLGISAHGAEEDVLRVWKQLRKQFSGATKYQGVDANDRQQVVSSQLRLTTFTLVVCVPAVGHCGRSERSHPTTSCPLLAALSHTWGHSRVLGSCCALATANSSDVACGITIATRIPYGGCAITIATSSPNNHFTSTL
jgi:hypothetical protein